MAQRRSTTVEVRNEKGLHLHVASLVAKAASRFDAEVFLEKGDLRANAKSVMSLALLAAPRGTRLTLWAEGSDAAEAVETLATLFEEGFGVP